MHPVFGRVASAYHHKSGQNEEFLQYVFRFNLTLGQTALELGLISSLTVLALF